MSILLRCYEAPITIRAYYDPSTILSRSYYDHITTILRIYYDHRGTPLPCSQFGTMEQVLAFTSKSCTHNGNWRNEFWLPIGAERCTRCFFCKPDTCLAQCRFMVGPFVWEIVLSFGPPPGSRWFWTQEEIADDGRD